jgi:hypothetical protein
MESTMKGLQAMDLAKEISKVPGGDFTIAFFPYSRTKVEASSKLSIREHCKFRPQLPDEVFSIDSENFFLFTDETGSYKMCYRYLIRFMGFPQDNYKLHKIEWL